jgi:predicted nucleic acid-binding protein
LRNSGYTEDEISETWAALAPIVGSKFLATTPTSHLTAARIRIEGLTYFDSLIAALAKEMQAVVVTKDAEIAKHVETQW